jgi:ethanolamine utilization microcompartment shell protein EutL
MPAGIQGADLAQLQQLVQQLGGPFQSELQSTLNGMNQKVQASSAYWVARNADQFLADFAQFVSKCEQQLNQILQEAAKASGQHLQAIQTGHRLGYLTTPARP